MHTPLSPHPCFQVRNTTIMLLTSLQLLKFLHFRQDTSVLNFLFSADGNNNKFTTDNYPLTIATAFIFFLCGFFDFLKITGFCL